MSPRIIAGSAKGRRVETPPRVELRPTTDRVRESLFSILMPRLAGASFLDLYAGTGLNGFEALSRGAARAVFADNHPDVVKHLEGTAARLGFAGQARVHRTALPEGISSLPGGPFDIVFLDPPYSHGRYIEALEKLAEGGLVAPGGLIICEYDPRAEALPESAGPWKQSRVERYGTTALTFFC